MRRAVPRQALVAFVTLPLLASCVSLDGDATGERWALGLVRQSVSPPDAGGSRMMTTTTVGVGLTTGGADGQGLALGYSRNVLLKLSKDACIDIETAGFCRELAATPGRGATP